MLLTAFQTCLSFALPAQGKQKESLLTFSLSTRREAICRKEFRQWTFRVRRKERRKPVPGRSWPV
jgi:hypothetical protein